jgi:hypothetical protein
MPEPAKQAEEAAIRGGRTCPICGGGVGEPPLGPWGRGGKEGCNCEVCGTYGYTHTAEQTGLLPLRSAPEEAYRVASFVREANLRGKTPVFYSEARDDRTEGGPDYPVTSRTRALESFPGTLSERVQRTLANIHLLQGDFDSEAELQRDRDHPVCFARDWRTMRRLLAELEQAGHLMTVAPSFSSVGVRLTMRAWQAMEEAALGDLSKEPNRSGGPRDEGKRMQAFVCHASEDKQAARRLCGRLRSDGFAPWLDEERLLPGQDWALEIGKAVRSSGAVVVCLSPRAMTKSGYVHKELRLALDVAAEQPEGAIFVVPARLEECVVPESLKRYQWVDLFRAEGYGELVRGLRQRAQQLGLTAAAQGAVPSTELGTDTFKALGDWMAESRSRWSSTVGRFADEDPRYRLPHGRWQAGYAVLGTFEPPSLAEFLVLLGRVQGHESGWPPWFVPGNEELRPYPMHGSVECWLGKGASGSPGHSDFWRASPEGRLYLLRGYEEDRRALRDTISKERGQHAELNLVGCCLWLSRSEVPPRRQHAAFAKELVCLVARTCQGLADGPVERTDFSGYPLLEQYLDSADLAPSGCFSTWDWGYDVKEVGASEEELARAILLKLRAARPAAVDENWLLVVSGHQLSQAMGLPDADELRDYTCLNEALAGGPLDKVYIFQYMFGRILEWSPVKGWAEVRPAERLGGSNG